MLLFSIFLMTAAALGAWLIRGQRANALLVISVIAFYALQPAGQDALDLALPIATLLLIVGVWWLITDAPTEADAEADLRTLLLIAVTAAILPMLNRLNGAPLNLSALPALGLVATGTAAAGAIVPATDRAARKRLALGFIVGIITLLVILKLPGLQAASATLLSTGAVQPIPINWSWLGFSYIAFRLMHILLDYRSDRLKPASLRDLALYVIFFPAISAGPIDRIEHFSREIETPRQLDAPRVFNGISRLAFGLFKKFVLADSLAYFALSPSLVSRFNGASAVIVWVAVYAYAFRIYLDFAGYSDIAIGIGVLAGIDLPENFTSPYSQRNIAAFWNSWHITLSTWFRNYFFTPFSRVLMRSRIGRNRTLIVFIAQICTMVLIGLWHGIALNFVLWGAWHGFGLWAHRWITERPAVRAWDERVAANPRLAAAIHGLSVLATFHFVALGWIFFVLPDLSLIGKTFAGLVGYHG